MTSDLMDKSLKKLEQERGSSKVWFSIFSDQTFKLERHSIISDFKCL